MNSEDKNEYPWKNGNWYSRDARSTLTQVDGKKVNLFGLVYLDFPEETKTTASCTWTYGEFGSVKPEIAEVCTVDVIYTPIFSFLAISD